MDILAIDNSEVRRQQIARLERVRAERDPAACKAALARLTEGAAGDGNLLALCVDAARARATVGEMSDAMETVFGRHKAEIRSIHGVYGSAYEGDEEFAAVQADVEAFAAAEGRRPRMLVVKLGQDGHDRGAKVIATAFADLGFDVDVGPLFQTPGRGRTRRGRQRRPRGRRVEPGGGPPDAGAPADRRAARGRAPRTWWWSVAG